MSSTTASFKPEDLATKFIRDFSINGHARGLSTPFMHSALYAYDAGARLPNKKDENALIAAGYLTEQLELSLRGSKFLELFTQRGDTPFLWAQDMAAKARSQPKLVIAA